MGGVQFQDDGAGALEGAGVDGAGAAVAAVTGKRAARVRVSRYGRKKQAVVRRICMEI